MQLVDALLDKTIDWYLMLTLIKEILTLRLIKLQTGSLLINATD